MTDKRKVLNLTVEEFESIGLKMVQNVATSHFIEAANDLYWKNTKALFMEITRKDITKPEEVRCLGKTFDASHKCRIDKEKSSEARRLEWSKISPPWLIAAVMLGISIWSNFFK